jgi:hypothetical protein
MSWSLCRVCRWHADQAEGEACESCGTAWYCQECESWDSRKGETEQYREEPLCPVCRAVDGMVPVIQEEEGRDPEKGSQEED